MIRLSKVDANILVFNHHSKIKSDEFIIVLLDNYSLYLFIDVIRD